MSVLKELVEGAYQVCNPCGIKYGKLGEKIKNGDMEKPQSFYKGTCDICDRETLIIEFRDYGYERTLIPHEKFTKEHLESE